MPEPAIMHAMREAYAALGRPLHVERADIWLHPNAWASGWAASERGLGGRRGPNFEATSRVRSK